MIHHHITKAMYAFVSTQVLCTLAFFSKMLHTLQNSVVRFNFDTHFFQILPPHLLEYYIFYLYFLLAFTLFYNLFVYKIKRDGVSLSFFLFFLFSNIIPAIAYFLWGRPTFIFTLSTLHILGAFLLMMTHVNHSKEKTTITIKIAGTAFLVFLILSNFFSYMVLNEKAVEYHKYKQNSLEDMWLAKTYAQKTAYVLSKKLVLHQAKNIQNLQPLQRGAKASYRIDTQEFFISYFLKIGDKKLEFGFPYLEYRQEIHDTAIVLLLFSLLGSFIFFLGLPFFLFRSLVKPIESLVAGIKDVNQGNFSHKLPIFVNDELGSLTVFFNKMTKYIDHSHSKLEKLNQELHKQQQEYLNLFNNLPVAVYSYAGGTRGHISKANPFAVKLFGYEKETELRDLSVVDLFIDQKERIKFVKNLQRNGTCYRHEVTFQRKDGSEFHGAMTASFVFDKDNRQIHFDGILEDITVLKKTQENLENKTNELRVTNTAYEKFVPKQFLQFLNKDKIIDISLGDHKEKKMSILFSDIRSFTTISEKMSPRENFDFINSYLKRIGPKVKKYNGFIDKYIGDAIMALYPDSIDSALDSAIEMLEELYLFNQKRDTQGLQKISIGVGIHTGDLTLGIIGEDNRMEGTVISDAVNLASRLENLTKRYAASIIISESSFYMLQNTAKYHYRKVDSVEVKGKQKLVSVYEIFNGNSQRIIDLKLATRDDFEEGIRAKQEGNFDEAAMLFEKVLQRDPKDKASQLYLERVKTAQLYGQQAEQK